MNEHAISRTRRVKLAIFTSLAGKGVSTIVQLVALPIAISALGQERFGVYAMLASVLNWMSIASVAITPGLTIQLVRANVLLDHEQEKRIFGSACICLFGLAIFLGAAVQIFVRETNLATVFGPGYFGFAGEIQSGMSVLTLFIAMNILLSVAEGAQSGYQNQYLQNAFVAVGNVVTILAIVLLVRSKPTIANMILAVYAAPLIGRSMSLVQLLSARRYLLSGLLRIDGTTVRSIASSGASFLVTSFASFCYQGFSVYWVGRNMGPIAAAEMAVFMIILGVSGSVLTMLTQPLWPAIQDAIVRGDVAWVRRIYLRIAKFMMAGFGIVGLTLAVGGSYIIHIWIKSALIPSRPTDFLLGLFLVLVAWEHLNYSFLIGIGRYWIASLSYLAGALIMLANSMWLVNSLGIMGMLAAMCTGPLLVTVWLYPMILRKYIATPLEPRVVIELTL